MTTTQEDIFTKMTDEAQIEIATALEEYEGGHAEPETLLRLYIEKKTELAALSKLLDKLKTAATDILFEYPDSRYVWDDADAEIVLTRRLSYAYPKTIVYADDGRELGSVDAIEDALKKAKKDAQRAQEAEVKSATASVTVRSRR